jgi:hypothetical protein
MLPTVRLPKTQKFIVAQQQIVRAARLASKNSCSYSSSMCVLAQATAPASSRSETRPSSF